jgi:hypothetical protein
MSIILEQYIHTSKLNFVCVRLILSNSCGQLGQSYQDYHCSEEEKHMECPVDPDMQITAVTHAKWWGAPGPLMCGPKSVIPQTGYWGEFIPWSYLFGTYQFLI